MTGSGTSVTVSYPVTAPGGSWNSGDNGAYTVSFNAGQVRDTSGNTAGSVPAAHFNVNIAAADTTPPTAAISPPSNITTATSNAQVINITYTDNVGIDTSAASIKSSNISVSGTGGPLTVGTPTISGSGTSVTVSYPVTAPGGSWDSADNGAYTVIFNSGQVKDTSGNLAAPPLPLISTSTSLPPTPRPPPPASPPRRTSRPPPAAPKASASPTPTTSGSIPPTRRSTPATSASAAPPGIRYR